MVAEDFHLKVELEGFEQQGDSQSGSPTDKRVGEPDQVIDAGPLFFILFCRRAPKAKEGGLGEDYRELELIVEERWCSPITMMRTALGKVITSNVP